MSELLKQKEFIGRCKQSVTYFINTCLKVKHPSIGIIPFKTFKYQQSALGHFRNHRFNIFRKCRQSGISTLTGGYCLWFGMFFSNKTILIVSKRDEDAKEFLDRNIKFAYQNLPQWMKEIWQTPLWNEHEVGFNNGSVIKSLTASRDTLRSNASSLNIIDEAAFIPDMESMWAGGWSCVDVSLTYLYNNGGIVPIEQLGDIDGPQWQDIDEQIQSDDGIQQSNKFYVNGEADINDIIVSSGLRIRCTDNHRLKDTNYDWIYSKDIKIGQKLAIKVGSDPTPYFDTHLLNSPNVIPQSIIKGKNADIINPICTQCGQATPINYRQYKRNSKKNGKFICQACATVNNFSPEFDTPKVLNVALSELIGYYIGDGSLSLERPKRLRLCYDPQDQDIYNHFAKYAESIGLRHHKEVANGADEFRIDNAKFVDWLRLNRINSKTEAADARVPDIILKSHSSIRAAFLRGLFEADGWCYKSNHSHRPNRGQYHLGLSSISEKLIDQVQLILLNLGIIFKKSESHGGYENSGKSWRLEATSLDMMIRFMAQVGFISNRKNLSITKQNDQVPSKYIIDDNNIFYDTVISVSRDRCMTADISVPSNNTYIANGFVSHNTLQHGGSVIVISTPNGVGNWYWGSYTGATDKTNDFNPIEIMWWEMDWVLEYKDPVSGRATRIAPTDGIRKCVGKEEIEKYGPYWSPWLESQLRALQQRGEGYLFRQEVLAEFLGSGGTILSAAALRRVGETALSAGEHQIPSEIITYIHPITGEEEGLELRGVDNNEGLWVWQEPIRPVPPIMKGNRIIRPGEPGHQYVIGVDIATGKDNDYSAIEVFDVNEMEQVAEYMGRIPPNMFCKVVDYIGRWYNTALVNIERTGIGGDLVDDVVELLYPNLWRKIKKLPSGIQYGPYGFATTEASKPTINKALCEFIAEDEGQGYVIKSSRLWKQLQIYIRRRNKNGFDTGKTGAQSGKGNHDDLVIGAGLAFLAISDLTDLDPTALLPARANKVGMPEMLTIKERVIQQRDMIARNDPNILMPYTQIANTQRALNSDQEIQKFSTQLTSSPQIVPALVSKRHPRFK